MTKEEFIKSLEEGIPVAIKKCRKTKNRWLKFYRLGKLYVSNEAYRRLTGKQFDISKAYFRS